ncbi:MAG: leucine-rich repeat domain-containing protein [Muribaculaceae bacterium]|nr:leucine-rich repeat domain-containing protein [Muribaculaceae bacterium]
MRLKLFLILGLLMGWMNSHAVTIKEVKTTTSGQLARLINESYYSADSLIVWGPIDEKDMTVLKSLTQKGKLTGLNLKNSSIEKPCNYWFTNDPNAPDSLQVKLKYIYLPDNCSQLGDFAFANVKSLVGINMDITTSEYFTFHFPRRSLSGTSIKTIDFGAADLIFDPYALQNAVELETIKGLGPHTYFTSGALYNTPKLRGSASFDGMLWFGDRVFSNSSLDDIILPEVEQVLGEAWFEFAKAKKITIKSNGIWTIPPRAFFGCQNLKSLTLPGAIETLKSDCLNQTGLEILTLPEGLKFIESDVMGWNIFLREIVFPSTLASIGIRNGTYLRALEKIYIKAQTPPECILSDAGDRDDTFTGANEHATLYVPKGTLEAYRAAPGWNYFSKIEEFDFSDVEQVKALPTNRPVISTGKGFMYLESPHPTPFTVFDMDGYTIQSGTVDGTLEVTLPAGIYLIKFGEDTQKVLVK